MLHVERKTKARQKSGAARAMATIAPDDRVLSYPDSQPQQPHKATATHDGTCITSPPMRTNCRPSKLFSAAVVLALVVALDLSNWNYGMETP